MIYLQGTEDKTRPYHFDTACAMYGAIESGLDYRLITIEEVISGKFDRLILGNLFVGSTEFMTAVFARIGLTSVGLPLNSLRPTMITTLGRAFEIFENNQKPIFIKPVKIKQFGYAILDGTINSHLNSVDRESQVYIYPVFEKRLASEWRIYVRRHKMVDSRNYSGDYTISPNYDYVNDVIESLKDKFPSSYVFDVGIFEDGENIDIEFNDMWAIGNYGVPNDLYLSMLKERYFDIIKNKLNTYV